MQFLMRGRHANQNVIVIDDIFLLRTFAAGKLAGSNEDNTAALHEALQGVTRLRIRSGGTCHRDIEKEKTLVDVRDAVIVGDLIRRIKVNTDKRIFFCMCCGNPTFEFYQDDKLIVALGVHHGKSLRWLGGKWKGDGMLTKDSADFLVKWLAGHGVKDEAVNSPKNPVLSSGK